MQIPAPGTRSPGKVKTPMRGPAPPDQPAAKPPANNAGKKGSPRGPAVMVLPQLKDEFVV